MAATLAAVVVANALFAAFVVSLVAPWLGATVRGALRGAGVPGVVAAGWWLPVAVALVVALAWLQLRYVRRETLSAVAARRVSAESHPDLYGRVTRLASQADAPVPAVYVADSDVPNSFALDGAGPPAVVVSRGLLDALDGDSLDAVLAHELAHVENRDATVMTLASFLPTLTSDRHSAVPAGARGRAILGVALGGVYVFGALATGTSPLSVGYAAGFLGGLAAAVVVGGVALGVFAALTVVAARRLSRYREFAADRGAAAITGDPTALADALTRLDDDASSAPDRDKRAAYGVRGLCLLPHGFGDDPDGFHVETRAHPPADERVGRLRELVG